jgi:dCMP deaminase
VTRPSWDEYFLGLVREVAKRATCDRGQSGCLIVKDRRIIASGYVGSPAGMPHCDEVGHLMKTVAGEDGVASRHCTRTIHAEQNAVCQAARFGTPVEGATLYCTMEPCRICAMLIVNAGLARVVAEHGYHAAVDSREIFAQAGVELCVISPEALEYNE